MLPAFPAAVVGTLLKQARAKSVKNAAYYNNRS
jgi:hypothetical protein